MDVAKQFNFRLYDQHLIMLDDMKDLYERNRVIDKNTGKPMSYNSIILLAIEHFYCDIKKPLEDRAKKVKSQNFI